MQGGIHIKRTLLLRTAGILFFILLLSLTFVYVKERSASRAEAYNLNEKTFSLTLLDDLSMDFVRIEPGTFMMGSDEEVGEEDEVSRHEVTIDTAFYIGTCEVTQAQWTAIMGTNPSTFVNDSNPVENVSYNDCLLFIKKLQKLTGYKIALPTEAQWEYSCRAQSSTKWFFGDTDTDLAVYAWSGDESGKTTHPVGQKQANPWGLYDMYGNVQEWCSDWYNSSYSDRAQTNPVGPKSGTSRVLRGGGWGDFSALVRSACRNACGSDEKNDGIGFRCILLLK